MCSINVVSRMSPYTPGKTHQKASGVPFTPETTKLSIPHRPLYCPVAASLLPWLLQRQGA